MQKIILGSLYLGSIFLITDSLVAISGWSPSGSVAESYSYSELLVGVLFGLVTQYRINLRRSPSASALRQLSA